MNDESASSGGYRENLSALEREKRIRGLFNFYHFDEGIEWNPILWDEQGKCMGEIGLDYVRTLPPLPESQRECYMFFTVADIFVKEGLQIADWSRCRIPEQVLYFMVNASILHQNFTEQDMCAFLSERAALAGWSDLEFLVQEDDVPLGVPIWWEKYLKLPDVNNINPVQICAFLIAAKMLPKKFGELDFLRFVLERSFISAAISPGTFGSVDKPLVWKMTPGGIAAAEQMGLLDAQYEAIDSSKVDITPGAGVLVEPASSAEGDVKRDISGFYSIKGLAERNNIPKYCYDKFSKRLLRWREKNTLSPDYTGHDAPSKNQPRYLFKESAEAIQHIIKCCTK